MEEYLYLAFDLSTGSFIRNFRSCPYFFFHLSLLFLCLPYHRYFIKKLQLGKKLVLFAWSWFFFILALFIDITKAVVLVVLCTKAQFFSPGSWDRTCWTYPILSLYPICQQALSRTLKEPICDNTWLGLPWICCKTLALYFFAKAVSDLSKSRSFAQALR